MKRLLNTWVIACLVAGGALAGTFTWHSDAANWSDCDSWDSVPESLCYPDDVNDDATIHDDDDHEITLSESLSIDDLLIASSDEVAVTFVGGYTLTCQTITVYGPNAHSVNDTFILSVDEGAVVKN